MARAKKIRDLPGVAEARAKDLARIQMYEQFAKKKFEDLNNKQKDELLKVVALRLGLVEPS